MGEFFSKIAGVQHRNQDGTDRQMLVRRLQPGDALLFSPELDNPYSDHAVAILRRDGVQIGYLPDDTAEDVFAHIQSGRAAWAEVKELTGGTNAKPTVGCNIVVRLSDESAAPTLAYHTPPRDPARPTETSSKRRSRQFEQTSKQWKVQMLLAGAVSIVGIIMTCAGSHSGGAFFGIGVLLAIVGLTWYVIARALAWWNHG